MKTSSRLAIIDWGIGGIGIFAAVRRAYPKIGVTYLSDTGSTPYGKMQRRELADRLDAIAAFLSTRGVTHLIIGCNAASTAIPDMRQDVLEIRGVIEASVKFASDLKPAKLGVIGGGRTVRSQAYRKRFEAKGIDVKQRIAQPLSAMIEAGDTSSRRFIDAAKRILAPLSERSHILLACTHYPAAFATLSTLVSDSTTLLDPADAIASAAGEWSDVKFSSGDEFMTTGEPAAMRSAAKKAFAIDIGRAKRVVI